MALSLVTLAALIWTLANPLILDQLNAFLRPYGFSFGPDGWLYVTCSSLQHVLFISKDHMRAHAPYQIFRFKPGPQGVPGQ